MAKPGYDDMILYGVNKLLLAERVMDTEKKMHRRYIFKKAKELYYAAKNLNCYGKIADAITKQQDTIGKPTITGAAFGVALYIAKEGIVERM